MASQAKDYASDKTDSYSDADENQPLAPQPKPRRRPAGARRPARRPQQQQGGGQAGPLAPVNQVLGDKGLDSVTNTAGGLVNGATGVLGGVAGNAVQDQGGKADGGKDTLRLRLDLNLEVEITLKARIHGDLELSLLN